MQSVLKRPNDSNENRSDSADFTDLIASKSKTDRQQHSPQQRRASEMRRGAGTGAGYGQVRQAKDDVLSESKGTSMKYKGKVDDGERESDTYYAQSGSNLTS